jgi:hypothetical protein
MTSSEASNAALISNTAASRGEYLQGVKIPAALGNQQLLCHLFWPPGD